MANVLDCLLGDTLVLSSDVDYETLFDLASINTMPDHHRDPELHTYLARLSEITRLRLDTFPEKYVARCLEISSRIHRDEILPSVKEVVITSEAIMELHLSSQERRQDLFESLEVFVTLASPDHLIVETIDQLYNPEYERTTSHTALQIVDSLMENWLEKGLKTLAMRGQWHHTRRLDWGDSHSLTYTLVWADVYRSGLNYSSLQSVKTPDHPYLFYSPLDGKASDKVKINWLVDQAYPHVHSFLMQELKKPSDRKLVVSCGALSCELMKKVEDGLVQEAAMMLGGRVEGMIGRRKRKTGRRTAKVVEQKVFCESKE